MSHPSVNMFMGNSIWVNPKPERPAKKNIDRTTNSTSDQVLLVLLELIDHFKYHLLIKNPKSDPILFSSKSLKSQKQKPVVSAMLSTLLSKRLMYFSGKNKNTRICQIKGQNYSYTILLRIQLFIVTSCNSCCFGIVSIFNAWYQFTSVFQCVSSYKCRLTFTTFW